jgi:hypothetical protein
LQPGADFRGYTKVIVDPPRSPSARIGARTIIEAPGTWLAEYPTATSRTQLLQGVVAASDIFSEAWRKGGYAIAAQPGPDVLRVKTAVANISVSAPEIRSSSRSHSFSNEAGQATLVVEVRDSLTGALLGRAIDQAIVGDNSVAWRTRVSNRADFRDVVEGWAKNGVRGMSELKALSPIR